ncbi:hypothetical protein D3C75_1058950 [compost metagenome]
MIEQLIPAGEQPYIMIQADKRGLLFEYIVVGQAEHQACDHGTQRKDGKSEYGGGGEQQPIEHSLSHTYLQIIP